MGKADKKGKKKKGGKYESLSEEGEGYFDVLDDHFELDAESDDDFDDEVPEEVPGYDSDTLWQTGGIEVVRSEGPAGLVTEEEGNGERWRSKGSKVLKTLRHFSYALLDRAIAANYEEEQIADILSLIIAEMGYQKDLDGLRKLLEKVSAGPGLLAALKERGLASLPASSVLALLSQSASNADKFIKFIAEAMEMEVLAVHRNVQANEELFETVSLCLIPSTLSTTF